MLSNKFIYFFILNIILSNISFAKDVDVITLQGKVSQLDRNNNVVRYEFSGNKAHNYLQIVEYNNTSFEIGADGTFSFDLSKKFYKPGRKVSFKIKKPNWNVISPVAGVFYLPDHEDGLNSVEPIELLVNNPSINNNEDSFIYAVQAITTRDETAALHLKSKLEKENKVLVYIEKYMVSNMPNNGFDYKVKVGEFKDKTYANNLRDKLTRKYEQQYGFFVTLKGYK